MWWPPKPAVHLLHGAERDGVVKTMCGLKAPEYWRKPLLTNVHQFVTCRRCLRWIEMVTPKW